MCQKVVSLLYKKKYLGLLILSAILLLSGCGNAEDHAAELSDQEVEVILADVVGGEEALSTAGLSYFSELSSDSKNLLSSEAVNTLVNDGADIFIMDLRSGDDYAIGHIQGATNIPWFEVGNNIEQLPKDQQIIVACYSGQSAGQTVGVLRMMGYDAVALLGGMNNGWYANEMPVVE